MARIEMAYLPGASFEVGKLNWPLASLTTVMVMVPPSFLALTSTPSIAPSSADVTLPERAAWLPDWANRLVDDATATVAPSATARSRLRLCMMGFSLERRRQQYGGHGASIAAIKINAA